MKLVYILLITFTTIIINSNLTAGNKPEKSDNELRVIMRADDIGFSHAANIAIIKGYKEGVITASEVLVPGPWFLEAAAMLKENPGLDVGVHLCLTAEWDQYKWGPVTRAKTLINEDGYFTPDNNQFLNLKPDMAEVENELRAQIKMAKKYIPQVSHLSSHMGTLSSSPELQAIEDKLSKEFNLPMEGYRVDYYDGLWQVPIEQKEDYLTNRLDSLQSGVTAIVFHLALDNDESKSITGPIYDPNIRMSMHRQAETDAVCSDKTKNIIKDKGIKLISYSNLKR